MHVERADPEMWVRSCLQRGVAMEEIKNFSAAAEWYARGLERPTTNRLAAYFLHNNLGYSLNQLDRFEEAEGYCRKAIEIEAGRYNAHKNLGVSLTGQKRYAEAADSFVKATRTYPGDARALRCLERLVAERPELLDSIASLESDLADCRKLVTLVEHRGQN